MAPPLQNQWDEIATEYCKKVLTPFSHHDTTDSLLSFFTADDISGRILDAGCGNGYFIEALQKAFTLSETPIALDSSRLMVTNASARLGALASVIRGSIDNLPFANSSFDHICAINSLISAVRGEREYSLKELRRVLSSNGKITLLLPALESYWEQLHVAREAFITEGLDEEQAIWEVYNAVNERLFDPIGGYINITESTVRIKLYTSREIERMLESAGFKVSTISKYHYSPEHCRKLGLHCDKDGLFDWLISACKEEHPVFDATVVHK